MSETLTAYQEAKNMAESARAALVAREAELRQELADVKAALGRRPRTPKANGVKKTPRKSKLASELAEQK